MMIDTSVIYDFYVFFKFLVIAFVAVLASSLLADYLKSKE